MPFLNNLLTYYKGLSGEQNWMKPTSSSMTDFYWAMLGAIYLFDCFSNISKKGEPTTLHRS